MPRLIGRRLLLMVPTLILASMLIFAIAEVLPGDVGRSILGTLRQLVSVVGWLPHLAMNAWPMSQ